MFFFLRVSKNELGQYPAILTSHLVNNPYIIINLSKQVFYEKKATKNTQYVKSTQMKMRRFQKKTLGIFLSNRLHNSICIQSPWTSKVLLNQNFNSTLGRSLFLWSRRWLHSGFTFCRSILHQSRFCFYMHINFFLPSLDLSA